MIGKKLGHYQITDVLGTGGMGEVYLALDENLDRTVALKILPAEVSKDPDRLRRFVQEARAASALHHPNVAHIYEIGEADGIHFIAMEHVEGETLNNHMKDKPFRSKNFCVFRFKLQKLLKKLIPAELYIVM